MVLDNVFNMLDWIRKNDHSDGKKYIFAADFLHNRHLRGVMETEDLWYCLLELMKGIIDTATYE